MTTKQKLATIALLVATSVSHYMASPQDAQAADTLIYSRLPYSVAQSGNQYYSTSPTNFVNTSSQNIRARFLLSWGSIQYVHMTISCAEGGTLTPASYNQTSDGWYRTFTWQKGVGEWSSSCTATGIRYLGATISSGSIYTTASGGNHLAFELYTFTTDQVTNTIAPSAPYTTRTPIFIQAYYSGDNPITSIDIYDNATLVKTCNYSSQTPATCQASNHEMLTEGSHNITSTAYYNVTTRASDTDTITANAYAESVDISLDYTPPLETLKPVTITATYTGDQYASYINVYDQDNLIKTCTASPGLLDMECVTSNYLFPGYGDRTISAYVFDSNNATLASDTHAIVVEPYSFGTSSTGSEFTLDYNSPIWTPATNVTPDEDPPEINVSCDPDASILSNFSCWFKNLIYSITTGSQAGYQYMKSGVLQVYSKWPFAYAKLTFDAIKTTGSTCITGDDISFGIYTILDPCQTQIPAGARKERLDHRMANIIWMVFGLATVTTLIYIIWRRSH